MGEWARERRSLNEGGIGMEMKKNEVEVVACNACRGSLPFSLLDFVIVQSTHARTRGKQTGSWEDSHFSSILPWEESTRERRETLLGRRKFIWKFIPFTRERVEKLRSPSIINSLLKAPSEFTLRVCFHSRSSGALHSLPTKRRWVENDFIIGSNGWNKSPTLSLSLTLSLASKGCGVIDVPYIVKKKNTPPGTDKKTTLFNKYCLGWG